MLDPNLFTGPIARTFRQSPDADALVAARALYNKTRRRHALSALWARLRGRPHRLPTLREAAPGAYPVAGQLVARQHIPLERIVGSEGRSGDFDRHFGPAQAHTRERWLSVAVAWLRYQDLPPVQLIALGDDYYVRDGHHRISVARAMGAYSVDAEIELWQTADAPAPARARARLLARP